MTNKEKAIKIGAIGLAVVLIIGIFSLIVSLIGNILGVFFGSGASGVNFSESYTGVSGIEIEALSSWVEIKTGDEFRVEATDVGKNFTAKVKNGVLYIEESKSLIGINDNSGKIEITVPEGSVLESLDIDTGAGKFVIDGIEVKEFDIDHGAGMLVIENSIFNEDDIDGGAGEIKISNTTLNNLDLDSGVGRVEIMATIRGNSQISCGVGEIDITLLGEEDDYSISLNKGIGNIKIKDIDQVNGTVYGSGSNKLKIDGGIGSISIDFE